MRHFVFVINNPTPGDIGGINHLTTNKYCRYLIYGNEVGSNGTPHLQGYCELNASKTIQQLKHHLPRAHFEERKGTPEQAAMYCKKDGDFVEFGSMSKQGERNDLNSIKKAIFEEDYTLRDIQHEFFPIYIKYSKAIIDVLRQHNQDKMAEVVSTKFKHIELRPWQKHIEQIIQQMPDPRKIYWCYDLIGNSGKSYYASYLLTIKNAYLVTGGTKADIFYAYNYEDIIVLDLSRDCQDKTYIYDVMENFKNGQFLSTKYETRLKLFSVPHVIVMSNFLPDEGKMSKDRIQIIDVCAFKEPEVCRKALCKLKVSVE